MVRGELLSLLNAEGQRLGMDPISPRALEDWISEDYFEGPDPKGRQRGLNPEWQYTAEAAERGLAVVRLRAAGTKRAAATRVRLFLRGFDIPLLRIKPDLCSEFARLLKRHVFRRPWDYEADKDATEAEKERQLRRAGRVDPVLEAAGLKAPDQTILDGGSALVWGIPGVDSLLSTVTKILSGIPILTDEIRHGLVGDIQPYIEILGLFGNPDEIERSGLEEIQKCSTEDIQDGHDFYMSALNFAEAAAHLSKLSKSQGAPTMQAALQKVARSIRDGDEWCTMIFAAGTVAAFRREKNKV